MGSGVSPTPWPPLPAGMSRYQFYRRLGEPQGRSGRAENLVPTGIRSRTVQPVAHSLYRLGYPAHRWQYIPDEFVKTIVCNIMPFIHQPIFNSSTGNTDVQPGTISTLKIEAIGFSVTSTPVHQTEHRHILPARNLDTHRREKVKYHWKTRFVYNVHYTVIHRNCSDFENLYISFWQLNDVV